MSEYIDNSNLRRGQLLELGLGILEGKRKAAFVKQYEEVIEEAAARDVIYVVDGMVGTGIEMPALKKAVSQFLNLLYAPLKANGKKSWRDNSFLNIMELENRDMESRMNAIKQLVKTINIKDIEYTQLQHLKETIRKKLSELKNFDVHYLRKENLLFPYLEKQWTDFRCLQVMWSLHDDVRVGLKLLDELLLQEHMSMEEFNYAIGTLYFSVFPIIYREENILFPVAFEELPEKSWIEMMDQMDDFGYAFIDPPSIFHDNNINKTDLLEGLGKEEIDLDTGNLLLDQIIGIFNHLPVNITFVDENDQVRYFNNSKERHFPRSKAILGRKVQNCHPPESIEVVNRIVDSFKKGKKDDESFWIQMKDRFIHIRYFAIRDKNGQYKGTLEVSQDVTDIRKLSGEKRLLD